MYKCKGNLVLVKGLYAVFIAWGLMLGSQVFADVKLPKIFGDGMVLQQGMELPIWGWADPNEAVTIAIGNNIAHAVANSKGQWKANLAPMTPGKPVELVIAGKNTIRLKDVLVGEVWVCSGQSNMELGIAGVWQGKECINNGAQATARADYPQIRLFKVKRAVAAKPMQDFSTHEKGYEIWQVCNPKNIQFGGFGGFSATGYFFGRELCKKLRVPIGLIDSSWGGTRIEPWLPPIGFAQDDLDKIAKNIEQKPDDPSFEAGLFNAMINPIVPFAIRGVIWYQGESNCGDGMLYFEKMKSLINGWRIAWQEGSFPFYFVQLASYRYNGGENLPRMWQAQLCSLSIPNTGMALTTDLVNDVNDVHPKNKQDVGKRLALCALAQNYGHKDVVYSGPLCKSVRVEGNSVCIQFDHAGGGLATRDDKNPDWFEVAAEDMKFVKARARIDANTIMATNAEIKKPTAVRFGWNEVAMPNLMNKEGLPAYPFYFVCGKNGKWHAWSSPEQSSDCKLMFGNGDSWCAIGDSITHGGEYHRFVYLYYITRFPEMRFDIHNCGCGGGITRQALERIESDILIHKPTVATIMFGINDIAWQNNKAIGSDDYINDMGKLIDRLRENNCKVIVLTPPIYDNTVESGNPVLPYYNGFDENIQKLRGLAQQKNVPLIDIHPHLKQITAQRQSNDKNFTLFAPDRVHPLETGHFIMAYDILKTQAVSSVVSKVEIDLKDKKIIDQTQCKLENVHFAGDGLSFQMLEKSLPFPLTEIPSDSRSLVPFEQDFNQELLKVIGLAPGKYTLSIDDIKIGDFTSDEFGRGVNIALFANTPQQRQAQKVGELNLKRHRITADKLRYIAMMEYGYLKRHYEVDDINTAKKDVHLFFKKNVGSEHFEAVKKEFEPYYQFKPIQSKLMKEAQSLNEQLLLADKPMPHSLSIKRSD